MNDKCILLLLIATLILTETQNQLAKSVSEFKDEKLVLCSPSLVRAFFSHH